MQHGHLELKPHLLPCLLQVPVTVEDLNEYVDYRAWELNHRAHHRVSHHIQTRRSGERKRERENNNNNQTKSVRILTTLTEEILHVHYFYNLSLCKTTVS